MDPQSPIALINISGVDFQLRMFLDIFEEWRHHLPEWDDAKKTVFVFHGSSDILPFGEGPCALEHASLIDIGNRRRVDSEEIDQGKGLVIYRRRLIYH